MNDSLFWQDGFPKERRVELVANLLYAGDPDARIPNNEGLRPECVEDFYRAVGFSSLGDFENRMDAVRNKGRYVEAPVPATIEVVPVPVPKIRRPRKPRVVVPEQPILPVPSFARATGDKSEGKPIVEKKNVVHAEDRISALARSVLSWFGRTPQTAEHAEMMVDDTVDPARMREVVYRLFVKELGANALQEGIDADPKARAHVEAANRLERVIATSARLDAKVRDAMHERLGALRTTYQDRMSETARAQSGELREGLDAVAVARERGGTHSALRVLALRSTTMADDLAQFREQIEHAAIQRGGAETVTMIDEVFQHTWQGAWKGDVTAVDIGPLEESLPRLRLLEGNPRSGVAQMVVAARASVQDEIDRRLPMIEREMKRAA